MDKSTDSASFCLSSIEKLPLTSLDYCGLPSYQFDKKFRLPLASSRVSQLQSKTEGLNPQELWPQFFSLQFKSFSEVRGRVQGLACFFPP
jgi:hypothetical protein